MVNKGEQDGSINVDTLKYDKSAIKTKTLYDYLVLIPRIDLDETSGKNLKKYIRYEYKFLSQFLKLVVKCKNARAIIRL